MIKRVIKIETTKEMVANDINELITGSDIDQEILGDNEYYYFTFWNFSFVILFPYMPMFRDPFINIYFDFY